MRVFLDVRGVVAALVAVGLAGCVSSVDVDVPDVGSGGILPVSARFSEPILVGPGGDVEVSLYVHWDNETVLACSHGGFRKPSPFWASVDGGLSFTEYFPEPNPVPSGDCDVAVLDDGSWVMIYDTIASTTVAVSRDRGATWSLNFVTAIPAGGVDRPWIMADGNDLVMVYANVMAIEPSLHFYARSTDHGTTWVDQKVINTADPPDRPNAILGHPFAYDDNRTIRVPIARGDLVSGGPTWFDWAVTRDGGGSWSLERVAGPLDTSFALPVASRGGDGTLYYALTQRNGSSADVMVTWSFDDGQTWSPHTLVASGVNFPGVRGPWIDGRPDGSASLAWLHRATEEDASGWTVWAARVDARAAVPVAYAGNITQPVDQQNLYEFIMVRHAPDGRAFVLSLVTGDGCKDPDPMSSRSAQCVWLQIEGG